MGLLFSTLTTARAQSFVNWENPHVHPLDLTPDGSTLLAVNTPDNRLELFDVKDGTVVRTQPVPVGLDPVSVRARSNTEAWVVNHISDTVSIVDLVNGNVIRTLQTADEPADVIFAGNPQRAFVSCSQADEVYVFDPANLQTPPIIVPIDAEDPRALAVSTDGMTVYLAVHDSGNATTILGGGLTMAGGFPPNVVNNPAGPYGGVNPPPNDGNSFSPPMGDFNGPAPGNPPPPGVGLIVRKNSSGQWVDDNDGDWTPFVSGAQASASGRVVGWDLPDRDVAIIDANALTITYATGIMNHCMAIAVNPGNNEITVVGTDATNEIRFEPNLNGRFGRVHLGRVHPAAPTTPTVSDLNTHLTYAPGFNFVPIAQAERDKSIGDPRGICWNDAGATGYVSGMGSNNIVVIDAGGARGGLAPTIEVGEGPTGVVLDESNERLYVLNKFASSISVVNTVSEVQIDVAPFHDPSPSTVKVGRKHLYDTHRNSGLGHLSCASCHVDARMDRLAWDLGDPQGLIKPFDQNCNAGLAIGGPCQDWHPMKGPMTTQTLQDIIGKEPHHWRADRDGLEQFAPAFQGLLGDNGPLPPQDMQEFEDFLATIHFPPNPFRRMDNTLPNDLPLPGHFTPGRFAPAGQPLPNGDAVRGLNLYRTAGLDAGIQCVSCHTLPTGIGTNYRFNGATFAPLPPGPLGQLHHTVVSIDGSTNISIKVPQLRNLYDKVGFETTQTSNRAGFGFLHDGSVDSLARFIAEPVFGVGSDRDIADLTAFMLAFSGSDLPTGSPTNLAELPGPDSLDTHAAVGMQITFHGANNNDAADVDLLTQLANLADAGRIGLVAKGIRDGIHRGYMFAGSNQMQADRLIEVTLIDTLRTGATPGQEITFTAVPAGSQERIGIDRDEDGFLDRDERDACSSPANPLSTPNNVAITDIDCDADVDGADVAMFKDCLTGANFGPPDPGCESADLDLDNDVDLTDFGLIQQCLNGPNRLPPQACLN